MVFIPLRGDTFVITFAHSHEVFANLTEIAWIIDLQNADQSSLSFTIRNDSLEIMGLGDCHVVSTIKLPTMKNLALSLLVSLSAAHAQTILFQDSFDTADGTNFDASDISGRISGTLDGEVVLRSFGAQQQISGNQLLLPTGTNGVRFEYNDGTFGADNRFNWAAGDTGAAILEAGGFTVSFDATHTGNATADWVSFQVGTVNADNGNLTDDDYGILFRQNGNTERFDNSVNLGAGGTFPATLAQRKIEIQYSFSSFDDGTDVTATSFVDGVQVASDTFQWDSNGGEMRMELGHNDPNVLIDNVTISLPTGDELSITLDSNRFQSGSTQGTLVSTLSAVVGGNLEAATFSLIAGSGDIDNDKFQINGDRLEIGDFDFTNDGSIQDQEFSIRVQVIGATATGELILLLKANKDDDFDQLLDEWEINWAGNLTTLSAVTGSEDSDNDGLTDLEEFQVSQGEYPGTPAYTEINPTQADADNDTLTDGQEIKPTGSRAATNPTNADTDLDGLSDLVETNTGAFIDASDTGSNPTLYDSDGDFARDSWEVTHNTDPNDGGSHPGSVSSRVTIVPITDDASTDIDPSKVYTHAISGGSAAVINGVSFDVLSSTIAPANFIWDAGDKSFNEVVQNNGDWLPEEGFVTGPGLVSLLESFSYSSTGLTPGSGQTYTLTNLTPGTNYDLRLYIRLWDTEGDARQIDLVFNNGSEQAIQPYGALPVDRPGALTGTGNHHEAYYLNFNYTAQTTELTIEANIAECNPAANGSFHLYGLTNEVSTGSADLVITNTLITPAGQFAIGFQGRPSTTYQITKSPDLVTPFVALDTPLSVTTDVTGAGQAVLPVQETSEKKYFFRVE